MNSTQKNHINVILTNYNGKIFKGNELSVRI